MKGKIFLLSILVFASFAPNLAVAEIRMQCPANIIDNITGQTDAPQIMCKHIAAGDGFARMADGKVLYIFGFSDVTGVPDEMVMNAGMLAAQFSAPNLKFPEGKKVYLTLSNVGMLMRPDLFDPHSIHWHGFPNAAPVFDGEPMASATINMGSSFTYYYEPVEPGTYMYHCHVEATEHMQMGMLGNLFVTPAQDGSVINGCTSAKYAYNDGDGSTCYDIDYPIQIQAFDSNFHEKHINIQPLPFAMMRDDYPMLNGRGYPDTVNPDPLPPLQENGGKISQPVSSLITANQGEKILLRISSLSTVEYYTLSVAGIPMKVVGKDARLLRSVNGQNMYYYTNSIMLGGGESYDVILDTSGVSPGTYVLYTTNLHNLSNGPEDFGGMMTEIVVQ